MFMTLQQQARQLEPKNIPVSIALVEESKTYAQNMEEYILQKRTTQKICLQKIAEKAAILKAENEAESKIWWFVKSENIRVTTNCPICADKCLLRVDRPVCSSCEDKYELGGIEA